MIVFFLKKTHTLSHTTVRCYKAIAAGIYVHIHTSDGHRDASGAEAGNNCSARTELLTVGCEADARGNGKEHGCIGGSPEPSMRLGPPHPTRRVVKATISPPGKAVGPNARLGDEERSEPKRERGSATLSVDGDEVRLAKPNFVDEDGAHASERCGSREC